MKESKTSISCKQIFILTFFLSITMFIGFGNSYLIRSGDTTTIIAAIVGIILGIIPVLLVLYISNYTNDKNIFEILDEKFGIIGKILIILIYLSILILGVVSIWNSLNFAVTQFLSKTPFVFIGIIFYLIIIYTTNKGIETVSRTATILFPIFIIFSLFTWIGIFPKIDLDNLFPILNIKTSSFISTALKYQTYSCFPIFLLLSIKKNDIIDKTNYKKAIILSYILASIYELIFLFFIITIFGNDMAQIYTYPEYTLFKQIEIFSFIEKIENIFAIIIFICFYIFNCIGVHFYNCIYQILFKFKNKRKKRTFSLIIELLLLISVVLLFTNYHPDIIINKYHLFVTSIPIVFIIIAILLKANKKRI